MLPTTSRIEILEFSGGLPPSAPRARADGRAGERAGGDSISCCSFVAFLVFFIFGARSTGPGRYPICSSVNLDVECIKTHVWGPPEARDMIKFVKHVLFMKDALNEDHS